MKSVLTTGEVAKICGLGISTIKRLIRRGSLSAYKTPGGDNRILRENLFAFMRSYGIPRQDEISNQEDQTVLLAGLSDCQQRACTATLGAAASKRRIVTVADDLAMGVALVKHQPEIVIFAATTAEIVRMRCEHVRDILAPAIVRLGVIGWELTREVGCQTRPDAATLMEPGAAWLASFIEILLAGASPALIARPQVAG